MNKNTNESWNYAKYRTLCILSEEMIREYGRAAWMERADELYEKVKQKIMELPISEAEQKMEQVDAFFKNILEGREFSVETAPSLQKKQVEKNKKPNQESSFYVKENVLGAKEEIKKPENSFYVKEHVLGAKEEIKKPESSFYVKEHVLGAKEEIKKPENSFYVKSHVLGAKEEPKKLETYDSIICALLEQKTGKYSYNFKNDEGTFRKVRKHFKIPEQKKIYFFVDYTIFGGCKEGVAVCEDGIHFRTISSKINDIKWKYLKLYDFQLVKTEIKYRKKNEDAWRDFWFLQSKDAENVFEILTELQKL